MKKRLEALKAPISGGDRFVSTKPWSVSALAAAAAEGVAIAVVAVETVVAVAVAEATVAVAAEIVAAAVVAIAVVAVAAIAMAAAATNPAFRKESRGNRVSFGERGCCISGGDDPPRLGTTESLSVWRFLARSCVYAFSLPQCATVTGVPSETLSKKCFDIQSGMRIQPCEAGNPGR